MKTDDKADNKAEEEEFNDQSVLTSDNSSVYNDTVSDDDSEIRRSEQKLRLYQNVGLRRRNSDIRPFGRTPGRRVRPPIEVELSIVKVGVDCRFPTGTKSKWLMFCGKAARGPRSGAECPERKIYEDRQNYIKGRRGGQPGTSSHPRILSEVGYRST